MLKNCVICGAEFETNYICKKTCSFSCGLELKRKTNNKKNKRRYKTKRRQKNCELCGNIYVSKIDSRFCSDKCRRRFHVPRLVRSCKACGEALKSDIANSTRYCDLCATLIRRQQNYSINVLKTRLKIDLPILKTIAIVYAFKHNNLNKETLDAIQRGETHYAYR